MSYCVNCGVELEGSLEECPLCNTPVYNPREIPNVQKETPFPREKGNVELVRQKDFGILLSVLVLATSITCGLLNLLVFNTVPWSLTIIGLCVLLWVILIPAVIYNRQPVYVSILFDGLAALLYLYMISYMVSSRNWFYSLGVPIVVLVTIVAELFVLCIRRLPKSFLTIALYSVTAVAVICIGLEILIDLYSRDRISLGWSAIVLTVCVIVDIAIITLLSRRRLRNAVRRRLHF